MCVVSDLHELGAPPKLLEAGAEVRKAQEAGIRPPYGVVMYIQRWVSRQQEQNRYGK